MTFTYKIPCFDLEQTAGSGQVFRMIPAPGRTNTWQVISQGHVCFIRQENENVKTGTTQLKEGSTYSGHMDTEAKKQFVLKQLALAWKAGETVGREKILEAAKKDHIPMTQKQARDLLKELEKEGLLQVGRGRGGSRITEKGLKKLEKQK